MDKFIKLLLEIQNTVIIPGLGAIVLDDPETGKLIFNEYLKFNDGKLDAIIVAESNMDLQEAQNYIAKYVREIQTEIDKGESYDIFGLGSIKKDEDGSIHFEGYLNNKGTPKSEKKEEVQGPSPTPTQPNEKKEEEKTDIRPVSEVKKDKKTPSDSKSEGKKESASEKVKKESPKETKKTTNDKETKTKVNKNKDVKPSVKKEKKNKLGVFFWIIIILLVIAGAGGTYIGLNYEQVKEYMGWNQFEGANELAKDMQDQTKSDEVEVDENDNDENEADVSEKLTNEDETATDDSFVEVDPIDEEKLETDEVEVKDNVEVEPETEASPEPVQEKTSVISGEYHLIAGTFTDKSNAEGLVSELKSQGHPAQIIGYLNGMHYVSVKSFDSASAAQQGISSVQSDVPKAWVYKKP